VILTVLEADGWEGSVVTTGEECLEELRTGPPPDVLVLDQVMPGLQGTEVAAKARQVGYDGPIVICSAYLGPAVVAELERLDLHSVSKIDLEALERICRGAVLGRALDDEQSQDVDVVEAEAHPSATSRTI
ncbi:MAG TPA: response regulator, partial [Mycobacteriales bacterium]|nr:response regulator [Mycobacteriales bacterium]